VTIQLQLVVVVVVVVVVAAAVVVVVVVAVIVSTFVLPPSYSCTRLPLSPGEYPTAVNHHHHHHQLPHMMYTRTTLPLPTNDQFFSTDTSFHKKSVRNRIHSKYDIFL
jgi:hypothetical protein